MFVEDDQQLPPTARCKDSIDVLRREGLVVANRAVAFEEGVVGPSQSHERGRDTAVFLCMAYSE